MPAAALYDDHDRLSDAFGKRLRELRRKKEMSQDGLGRETNIHPTSIARLERGDREPQLSTILKLAKGLDVDPGLLVNALGRPAPQI